MASRIAATSSRPPAPPRSRPWRPTAAAPSCAADRPKIKPTADTLILLWMAGGMAHTETFDPKRHTPFRKG